MLGSVAVGLYATDGYARYDGLPVVIGEPTEWTIAEPTYTSGEVCGGMTVSVDIDLYPPTVTITVDDSFGCMWTGLEVILRTKGADLVSATYSASADNVWVDPTLFTLSAPGGAGGTFATSLPAALSSPYPTWGPTWWNLDPSTNTYTLGLRWNGDPAFLDGTAVIGLVMNGVPAAPVAAGAGYTG